MPDRLLVATRKGLFTLEPIKGQWRIVAAAHLGVEVSAVLHDPRTGRLFAALDHGHFGAKLQRCDGHGDPWREVPAPAYPPKPDDAPDIREPIRNAPVPWDVKMIWSLDHGGDDQPGRLWAGVIPGGLFRSDDHGDSWTLNMPLWNEPDRAKWFGGGFDLPGIHSVLVDPRDSKTVRVGVSCGGVWESHDDGESWALCADGMHAAYVPPDKAGDPALQDPHRVVQCPGQPDTFWTQHHNGIFRSTDGCASWREVTPVAPSSFGFAVAVHPDDGDTAWFVPAVKDEIRIPVDGQLVVTRTRDGGQSFDQLTAGLPQDHAYDLVFRHALAIDPAGQRLAFGSTTGNLFISEDQGDHWTHVHAHLPPVYAVRFA